MRRKFILPRFFKAVHVERLLLVSLIALTAVYMAQGQSALDGFDPNVNGTVNVVVIQPDGKILIGGDFTTLSPNGGATVTRNRIARLNPDGTLDTAFNPNANGIVRSIAVQVDGKVLVGGQFTTIGGQTRNYIARLDVVTGLADSFDPSADDFVLSIALQADGRILLGGAFTNIGGATRNRIARLDATSGAADLFDPNVSIGSVNTIKLQTDGKILVGGSFLNIGGQTRNYIARLDPVSGVADSFNPNANNFVETIAIQADGKILAGGGFINIGGQLRRRIARLDPVSGLADSFNPDPNGDVFSVAVQADGKILAGGNFVTIGGQLRVRFARLDSVTGFADSFDPNAGSDVYSIAVQADGKILAAGNFTTLEPNGGSALTRNRIARLEPDGTVDASFNPNADFSVYSVAVQPDGKVLICGQFLLIGGQARNRIARLNKDGSLDTSFDPNADSNAFSIAVQADGKILVGGIFSTIGGLSRNRIARLNADGTLDLSFDPNATNSVLSIVVQSDGKIIVGGALTVIGGQTRNRIARLNADGTLDASFDPNADSSVFSIVVQPDGKILVGGFFTTIGGLPRNRIARLNVDGTVDTSFNPNANDVVNAIAVQPDGKILVGGSFTTIGGQARSRVARLNADGTLDPTFDPNSDGTVYSIAVQSDGKILAGGSFIVIAGNSQNRIARLNANGSADSSFNPIVDSTVLSTALEADGKVLMGGQFATIGGQSRNRIARLSNDTAALQNLAVTLSTLTWTRDGSSPQFNRVTFESSTDNVNYNPLGSGTLVGSNWTLTGLNLPTNQNIYIRARGYYRTGYLNGSESIQESVRNAFIAGPTLGTYANTSIALGANTTITPSAPPTDTTSISVSTTTGFVGKLTADPATGVVTVTNAAHAKIPAGAYPVTVRAFGPGGSSTATFNLTITATACTGVTGFTSPAVPEVTLAAANPRIVMIGDFNGDSNQDFATANQSGSNVSIRLGNGSGGFSSPAVPEVTVGTTPYSIAVGDFNGDGNQDFATANIDSNNASIRLGNGAGGFTSPAVPEVTVGTNPFSITVGDFNGDGKQDFATANDASSNVSIRLGNGSGGFTSPAVPEVTVGARPFSVVVGDFNGDGNQDFAAGNRDSSNVSIRLGNGTGGFTSPAVPEVTVGGGPRSVAIGDFNGDGNQDFATANQYDSNVSIRLGNGTGGFTSPAVPEVTIGAYGLSVAVGDFNGDGNQDFAAANNGTNNVSIRLGNGSGGFTPPAVPEVAAGAAPISVAVGDLNGDGIQDFVAANFNSDNVSIRLGTCMAATPTATNTPTGSPTPTPTETCIAGSLDPSFNGTGTVTTQVGSYSEALGIAIAPDGKIVAAGYGYDTTSLFGFAIIRYNSDGSLDTTFNGTGKVVTQVGTSDAFAYAVALQPDGRIVAAGYSYNNFERNYTVVRYNTNGLLDTSFGGTGIVTTAIGPFALAEAYAVALQSDGKIIVAGNSRSATNDDFTLVRYNANGTLDTTFNGIGKVVTPVGINDDGAYGVAVQSDGAIVAAGYAYDPTISLATVRYNPDGTLDTTFNGTGKVVTQLGNGGSFGTAVAIQFDGKIVVAGSGDNQFGLVRYNTNGSLDISFNGTGKVLTPFDNEYAEALAMAIQSDGKIVAAGYSSILQTSTNQFAAARYNTNGTLDTSFNGTGKVTTQIVEDDVANTVAIQSDGRIVAAGNARVVLTTNVKFGLARYFASCPAEPECVPMQIDYGQNVGGNLNSSSCLINGPTDLYTFTGTAGQNIAISLDSLSPAGIQPSLELIGIDGTTVIASNSGTINARIPTSGFFQLPSNGSYTIRASTSPGNFGDYSLLLNLQPTLPGSCSNYGVSPAVTNVVPGGGTYFFDVVSEVGCPTVTAALGANSSHITILSNTGGRVTFNVAPYGGSTDRTGTITVNNGQSTHTITQFGILAPANDAFASAQVLVPLFAPITVNGRNTNATFEAGEPVHAGSTAARSVWYKWTAPTGDLYSFTTSGSDFDTVMAIYTGPSVGNLTRIAENDDTTYFDQTSKINFRPTAGTEYYIAIDGRNGSSGSIVLVYRQYSRLYRLYLQNFNGYPTSIVPTSVTAVRQDSQGPTINGALVSLGVYEFDLPDDNLPYVATISGPSGITWQPSTYAIDNTFNLHDELMVGPTGGGQNQTSNPTNTIPQHFFGYIHGVSSLTQPTPLSVQIASTGSNSAVPPYVCGPPLSTSPVIVTGGPGGTMRVRYDCLTQPNSTHQIVPNAPQTAFQFPVLPLPRTVINSTHLATSEEAISATSSPTFNISGQVRDGSQGLNGVVIDISTAVFTMRVTSDSNGNYVASNLAPGQTYTLRAVRSGYVFLPEVVTLTSANAIRDIPSLPCSYIFSGDGNFTGFGGQGEFVVTQQSSNLTAVASSPCTWTADRQPDSNWVSVLSSSNLGNGTVQFSVKPNPGPFRSTTINVGTQGFVITQGEGFPITGAITYGNTPGGAPTPRFVSNVHMNGVGSYGVSTVSSFPDGTYSLAGFGAGAYTVSPSKVGSANGAVSSFDAGRIALHVAGPPNPQLSGNQLIVADVSGNGSISSLDAGMIAKFAAGPPYAAPGIGQTATWKFSPVTRTYPIVNTSISGQDYSALLMGDVTGNWVDAGAMQASSTGSSNIGNGPVRAIAITAPRLESSTGKEVVIPISIEGAANKGIISYEFDLRYDPLVIQPLAEPVDLAGTASRGLSAVTNASEPGLLRVVVYGAMAIEENGLLLKLRFAAVGKHGLSSPLQWERILFNEGDPASNAIDGLIELFQ